MTSVRKMRESGQYSFIVYIYIAPPGPGPHALKNSALPSTVIRLTQDVLDKLMRFLPQPSDFVPLNNGFHVFPRTD